MPDIAATLPSLLNPAQNRVLIIEDSLVIRGFLRRTVHGCLRSAQLRECEDGEVAMAALMAEPADLVVTDLQMPRLDGRSLLLAARSKGLLDQAGIIIISSSIKPPLVKEFEIFPRLLFLRKPATADEIRAAIQRLKMAGVGLDCLDDAPQFSTESTHAQP